MHMQVLDLDIAVSNHRLKDHADDGGLFDVMAYNACRLCCALILEENAPFL